MEYTYLCDDTQSAEARDICKSLKEQTGERKLLICLISEKYGFYVCAGSVWRSPIWARMHSLQKKKKNSPEMAAISRVVIAADGRFLNYVYG